MKNSILVFGIVFSCFLSSISHAESTKNETAVESQVETKESVKKSEILVQDAKTECKKQGKEGPELVECVKKIRESK